MRWEQKGEMLDGTGWMGEVGDVMTQAGWMDGLDHWMPGALELAVGPLRPGFALYLSSWS